MGIRIERDGEPLERLVERLSDPRPLLAQIGQDLAALLQSNLSPGHGQDTGLMKSAFADYEIYPVAGGMAVGVGNAKILTDWDTKAPAGTIAAFVRWLREQNSQNVMRREKTLDDKRRVREAKRAAMEKVHAKWDQIKASRRERQREFHEYLETFSGRNVDYKRLSYLERRAKQLARGKSSFATLRYRALEYGIKHLKLSPKRLIDYYKSVSEQLSSQREIRLSNNVFGRLDRQARGTLLKQKRAEAALRGKERRQRAALKPIRAWYRGKVSKWQMRRTAPKSVQKWFTGRVFAWRAKQVRIATQKAKIAWKLANKKYKIRQVKPPKAKK